MGNIVERRGENLLLPMDKSPKDVDGNHYGFCDSTCSKALEKEKEGEEEGQSLRAAHFIVAFP